MMTPRNSRLPKTFYLSESNIIGKKDVTGLYTSHKIKKGSLIGEYFGKVLTHQEAAYNVSNYMFEVKSRSNILYVLDAKTKKHGSFLRYVNSANYLEDQNAEYFQHGRRILLRARRTINPNSEILAWYGKDTTLIVGL